MYKCVTTQVDSSLSDLFTSSRSPSHIDLCYFKVSVLVPLQWGHQTLSCFGFPTCPHTSHMCSPFSMWTKSYSIAIFSLDLKSANPFIKYMNKCQHIRVNWEPFNCILILDLYLKKMTLKSCFPLFQIFDSLPTYTLVLIEKLYLPGMLKFYFIKYFIITPSHSRLLFFFSNFVFILNFI
jgi:hypothetical protein